MDQEIEKISKKLMKELEYGKGYKYAHDYEDAFVPQEYLPEKLQGQVLYEPTDAGFEKTIRERVNVWRRQKNVKEKK